jgi:WD40-like Beta Propeller Repeat
MKRKLLLVWLILVLSACAPTVPDANATATQDALTTATTQTAAAFATPTALLPVTPTSTLEPQPIPSESATATAAQAPQGETQFLAYIKDGQLLVTDVTNGVQGGTTQYTVAGQSDQLTDLVWSPSGEFVAFVSTATGTPHIFYIFALGQSSPTDLGPGSAPDWSPDSTSIAFIGGTYPNEDISITTIENPSPRPLTFESNYAWGRPVFTPDGSALIVAGANRDNMGAQGNTSFTLDSLALDGSGTHTPLPGATPLDGMRLPYDLRFSPDGSKLAFSTSSHWSACAAPGAYYVSSPDGRDRQELVSPSLKTAIDPNQEHFHVGLSYAWSPASDGIIALGNVIDCNLNSPSAGQTIAGPQMSTIGLDGSEGLTIPGFFYGISMDRTGTLIAAAHLANGFQDLNPTVEIYSGQSGQLVLSLGSGSNPQFQP